MHPFVKLALIIAAVVVVLWLVKRLREWTPNDSGRPVPVGELPPRVRDAIDHQIAHGKPVHAIKIYRDATKAGLAQAKQAIDARELKRR